MAETNSKPLSDSLTMKSVLAVAVALVAGHFRFVLPEGVAQSVASSVIDLVSTLGLIGAAVGRVRAQGPIS